MSCPLGYTSRVVPDGGDVVRPDGEEEEKEDEEEEEEEEEEEMDSDAEGAAETERKKRSSNVHQFGANEENPLSWFANSNIASEEEFQGKKEQLQIVARARLDQIMKAKKKLRELDPNFDGSMGSDQVSELDCDEHSLCSLKSGAESWMDRNQYNSPAEAWVKFTTPVAMAVSGYSLYLSYNLVIKSGQAAGMVQNSQWPLYCMISSFITVLCCSLFYLAALLRSKRMLLSSQIGCLMAYASAMALVAGMCAKPMAMDFQLHDLACNQLEGHAISAHFCSSTPKVGHEVAAAFPRMVWSCVWVCVTSVLLAALGVWYAFELAYVEKRASKHRRRVNRSKFSIPWDKITVSGPDVGLRYLGGGKGGAAGGGGGGALAAEAAAAAANGQ